MTRLFYDGTCGLCQRAVWFTAKRDRSGGIRFAPLGGITFDRLVPADAKGRLPDSLVVLTPQGRLLIRSDAAVHLLVQMGPGWRALGVLLAWIPRSLRDAAYDLVARGRSRSATCPMDKWPQDGRFEP